MIVLGVILLLIGYFTGLSILYTIGGILLIIGVVLWVLGAVGRPVGGRKVWFSGARHRPGVGDSAGTTRRGVVMATARHPRRGDRRLRGDAPARTGRRPGRACADTDGVAAARGRRTRPVRRRPRRSGGVRARARHVRTGGDPGVRRQPIRRRRTATRRTGHPRHRGGARLASRRTTETTQRSAHPGRRPGHRCAAQQPIPAHHRGPLDRWHHRRDRHRHSAAAVHDHLLPARRPQHLAVRHQGGAAERSGHACARPEPRAFTPWPATRGPRHWWRSWTRSRSAADSPSWAFRWHCPCALAGLPRRVRSDLRGGESPACWQSSSRCSPRAWCTR